MWRVYILKCQDGSFYTGITTDIERRWRQHLSGRASKYTRSHRPACIYHLSEPMTHSEALRMECRIKQLSHNKKERMK
jgi:putative endonuclease